jgi:hypothetical protein
MMVVVVVAHQRGKGCLWLRGVRGRRWRKCEDALLFFFFADVMGIAEEV